MAIEDCDHLLKSSDIRDEIPFQLADESVFINRIKGHFERTAWKHLTKKIEEIKLNYDYECETCRKDLCDSVSVACDACLRWYHLKCIGRTKEPVRDWFCLACTTETKKLAKQLEKIKKQEDE